MTEHFVGRKRPYSNAAIAKVPCARCGRPSVHQWQACANGRRYVAICLACDIALNKLVLRFMRIKGRRKLIRNYREGLLNGS